MTTIACTRHEMAADGRVTSVDGKSVTTFPASKLVHENNAIYGTAGDYQAGTRFFEWVRRGEKGKLPRLCKDFAALKLTRDGIFVLDVGDPTRMRCDHKHFAIGSGAPYAIGAMEFGAKPQDAVRTAMKWDVWSGGEATVLSLPEKT